MGGGQELLFSGQKSFTFYKGVGEGLNFYLESLLTSKKDILFHYYHKLLFIQEDFFYIFST